MENKKGQGIFLGVVGVATLVVAIIGATFAYFSASASAGNSVINGQTLGGSGSVFGLDVHKVTFTNKTANSLDLVPTNINTAALIAGAINANCEQTPTGTGNTEKYTGCHLYEINASTGNSPVVGTTLKLTELTSSNSHGNDAKWHYALFTVGTNGQVSAATNNLTASGVSLIGSIGDFDLDPAASGYQAVTIASGDLAANTNNHYYLMVYVENVEEPQNAADTNDVTGAYQGTIEFKTADGETVKATFTAAS